MAHSESTRADIGKYLRPKLVPAITQSLHQFMDSGAVYSKEALRAHLDADITRLIEETCGRNAEFYRNPPKLKTPDGEDEIIDLTQLPRDAQNPVLQNVKQEYAQLSDKLAAKIDEMHTSGELSIENHIKPDMDAKLKHAVESKMMDCDKVQFDDYEQRFRAMAERAGIKDKAAQEQWIMKLFERADHMRKETNEAIRQRGEKDTQSAFEKDKKRRQAADSKAQQRSQQAQQQGGEDDTSPFDLWKRQWSYNGQNLQVALLLGYVLCGVPGLPIPGPLWIIDFVCCLALWCFTGEEEMMFRLLKIEPAQGLPFSEYAFGSEIYDPSHRLIKVVGPTQSGAPRPADDQDKEAQAAATMQASQAAAQQAAANRPAPRPTGQSGGGQG